MKTITTYINEAFRLRDDTKIVAKHDIEQCKQSNINFSKILTHYNDDDNHVTIVNLDSDVEEMLDQTGKFKLKKQEEKKYEVMCNSLKQYDTLLKFCDFNIFYTLEKEFTPEVVFERRNGNCSIRYITAADCIMIELYSAKIKFYMNYLAFNYDEKNK